jgi:hypothetical protein
MFDFFDFESDDLFDIAVKTTAVAATGYVAYKGYQWISSSSSSSRDDDDEPKRLNHKSKTRDAGTDSDHDELLTEMAKAIRAHLKYKGICTKDAAKAFTSAVKEGGIKPKHLVEFIALETNLELNKINWVKFGFKGSVLEKLISATNKLLVDEDEEADDEDDDDDSSEPVASGDITDIVKAYKLISASNADQAEIFLGDQTNTLKAGKKKNLKAFNNQLLKAGLSKGGDLWNKIHSFAN